MHIYMYICTYIYIYIHIIGIVGDDQQNKFYKYQNKFCKYQVSETQVSDGALPYPPLLLLVTPWTRGFVEVRHRSPLPALLPEEEDR